MVTKERKGTLNSLSFPKKNHHSQGIVFPCCSFSFLFFVEKYRTKVFLVKFDKEQTFFFIPAILFLYVLLLFVLRVPEKITSRSLTLVSIITWSELNNRFV